MPRKPPKDRVSPSTHPELDLKRKWREEYDELMADGRYNQTSALEEIGRRYNAGTTTIRYWLFKNVRRQSRARSRERARESRRTGPEHKREIDRKRAYVHYHLDEVLEEVFQAVKYQPQDLRELALLVKQQAGFGIRPTTILKLSEEFHERQGAPLLEEVVADEQPKYSLHPTRGQGR